MKKFTLKPKDDFKFGDIYLMGTTMVSSSVTPGFIKEQKWFFCAGKCPQMDS